MNVRFTKKQSAHVLRLLKEWVRLADERGTLPPIVHTKMKLMVSMIEDEIGFDETDFAFLAIILQLYFESFEEDDVDPLAEQAYAKCAGEWYILPPWYDRTATISQTHNQLGT